MWVYVSVSHTDEWQPGIIQLRAQLLGLQWFPTPSQAFMWLNSHQLLLVILPVHLSRKPGLN